MFRPPATIINNTYHFIQTSSKQPEVFKYSKRERKFLYINNRANLLSYYYVGSCFMGDHELLIDSLKKIKSFQLWQL